MGVEQDKEQAASASMVRVEFANHEQVMARTPIQTTVFLPKNKCTRAGVTQAPHSLAASHILLLLLE
jgi:hypothetical protein